MFTGSTATGRFVGERAGENLIDCTLELGGKNPLIVLPDANLDEVVPGALFGAFLNAGQACMHIERIYVPESRCRRSSPGGSSPAPSRSSSARRTTSSPQMGSLVSHRPPRAGVRPRRGRAVRRAPRCSPAAGRDPTSGPTFYEPTVLRGVTKQMMHGVEETFGPVTTIYTYDDLDDAVAMANDTDYGLNASVWGTDLAAAEAVGRRIQAGNINVNDSLAASYASKATPSGGLKNSGVGARHGDAGLLKYTDPVNVAVMKKQVLTPAGRHRLREARQADRSSRSRRCASSASAEASGDLQRALRQAHPVAVDALLPGRARVGRRRRA